MDKLYVHYCSHPDGHSPADCPDRLRARVSRLEGALSCLLNELDEHPPVTCDAMKSAFAIARAALAEKE